MNHIIRRLERKKFRLYWEDVPNSGLILNFSPIISEFNLRGKFCLLHWQARPKGLRRWGIYDSEKDWYYSFEYNHLINEEEISNKPIQISERKWNTVPTAVLIYENTSVSQNGNTLILHS